MCRDLSWSVKVTFRMLFMFFPFGKVQLGAGLYGGVRCLPTDGCCVRSLADLLLPKHPLTQTYR